MSSFMQLLTVIVGLTAVSCTARQQAVIAEHNGLPHQRPANASSPQELPAADRAIVQAAYGKLPLRFEKNQGQANARVQFLSRGYNAALFLTSTEAVLAVRLIVPSQVRSPRGSAFLSREAATSDPSPGVQDAELVFRMGLAGANPLAQVTTSEELPGKVHYLIGGNPHKWQTDVPTYARVRYQAVYPGIDLVYYGNQRQLEYDFIVAPGADPGVIKLDFRDEAGHTLPLRLEENGDLVVHATGGELRLRRPHIYQEDNGVRHSIPGHYVLLDGPAPSLAVASSPRPGQVGFAVAAYDPHKPLVIDPVLVYSTYLGGGDEDCAFDIAVDSAGNIYLAGGTRSVDFPTERPLRPELAGNGAFFGDVYIAKLSPLGSTLLYSTYLGGRDDDRPVGIAVDVSGNLYVAGDTESDDFPTERAYQSTLQGDPTLGVIRNIFVAKLNPAGAAPLYSTYLGCQRDNGEGMAVDTAGHIYVTGLTRSADFPTKRALQPASGGIYDAVVAKFDPSKAGNESLVYSTYLGGDGIDTGWAIAVDAAASVYVTGTTSSTDLPTETPVQSALRGPSDAFVAKLNPEGSALVYATYLGGSKDDDGLALAVDDAGSVYLAGHTTSPDVINLPPGSAYQPEFGGSGAVFGDAYVAKLNAAGSALEYFTYLGSAGSDYPFHLTINAAGHAYVTGYTDSRTFPTKHPVQPACGGGFDAFVAKIAPSRAGEAPWSTPRIWAATRTTPGWALR